MGPCAIGLNVLNKLQIAHSNNQLHKIGLNFKIIMELNCEQTIFKFQLIFKNKNNHQFKKKISCRGFSNVHIAMDLTNWESYNMVVHLNKQTNTCFSLQIPNDHNHENLILVHINPHITSNVFIKKNCDVTSLAMIPQKIWH